MNIFQKITEGLMSPNEMLTNIITVPFFIIEAYIYINLFITLFAKSPSKKNKYLCMLILVLSSIISRFLIPIPYNTIFNVFAFAISYKIFLNSKILESFIGVGIQFLLTALFEMISTRVYTLLIERPYSEYANYPIYAVIFMCIVYSCLYIMVKLLEKFNINITLFKN